MACSVYAADKYQTLLLVLSGMAVAVFNFFLWDATKKLWRSAEKQLIVFRASSNSTEKTASAHRKLLTDQGAVITRQVGIIADQYRLSLFLYRATIHPVYVTTIEIDPVTRQLRAGFEIQMKNVGPTQARNMRSWWRSKCYWPPQQVISCTPGIFEMETGSRLASQRSWNTGVIRLSASDLYAILTGRGSYFIWGKCEFNDAFEGTPRHWLTHCVELICPPAYAGAYEQLLQTVLAGEGKITLTLNARATDYHNDSDDYGPEDHSQA